MSGTNDGLRFHIRMGETLEILSRSLAGVVEVVTARHAAYFRPSLCELLNIPEKLKNSHAELVRDYKVVYRRYCLLLKKLRATSPSETTVQVMMSIREQTSEVWRALDGIEKNNTRLRREMAFIDRHLSSVKEFLGGMREELNDEDDSADSGRDGYTDIEDNRDYPF